MAHYFTQLPNIRYKNPLKSSNQDRNYVTTKNLFLRAKVRDAALRELTFLTYYTIKEGERPQDVAEKLYGNPEYDWVILISANIINVRDEWPMTGKVLYDYCAQKYGNEMNSTAYYETKEVRDAQGRLVLPAGKKVDADFTIPDPDNPGIRLGLNVPVDEPILIGVSNFGAETKKNEQKRNIRIIKNGYLTSFLAETRKLVKYTKSSQYEDRNTKAT